MSTTNPTAPQDTKHLYKIIPDTIVQPMTQPLPLSTLDASSGFIHLSTATQVPKTASRFFTTATDLTILKFRLADFTGKDKNEKGKIVWEVIDSGEIFPHLYDGDLGPGNIHDVLRFTRREGERWEDVLAVGQEGLDL